MYTVSKLIVLITFTLFIIDTSCKPFNQQKVKQLTKKEFVKASSRVLISDILLLKQSKPITHGSRTKNFIALTFDACHTHKSHGYDSTIIQILKKTQTPATLFLFGSWMQHYPEVTRTLANDSLFELANHTFWHSHLTKLKPESIAIEISTTNRIMFSLSKKSSILFRPPYGEWDSITLRIANSLGLRTILWDVNSGDPDPNMNKDKIVESVLSNIKSGSIVLFHMNGRGWHTSKALPQIIEFLRKKGYKFGTVSKLLANPKDR